MLTEKTAMINALAALEPFERPTVWVINRSSHDYSGAERFGTVRVLSDGPVNRYATGKIFRAFAFSLRESKPSDYILLTGLTVMACIACSIFAVKHKTLNMLIFKPATHTYCERRMDLHDLEDFENEPEM